MPPNTSIPVPPKMPTLPLAQEKGSWIGAIWRAVFILAVGVSLPFITLAWLQLTVSEKIVPRKIPEDVLRIMDTPVVLVLINLAVVVAIGVILSHRLNRKLNIVKYALYGALYFVVWISSAMWISFWASRDAQSGVALYFGILFQIIACIIGFLVGLGAGGLKDVLERSGAKKISWWLSVFLLVVMVGALAFLFLDPL